MRRQSLKLEDLHALALDPESENNFSYEIRRSWGLDYNQNSSSECNNDENASETGGSSLYVKNNAFLEAVDDVQYHSFRWIIFPNNQFIKVWDQIIVLILLFSSMAVPYQVGVSIGYNLVYNTWWFSGNIIIDSIFMVDTFLYFFRAYRDKETSFLVINLKKIRRNYLKSYFVINFISSLFPSLFFVFLVRRFEFDIYKDPSSRVDNMSTRQIMFLIPSLLRLLRFIRTKNILSSSRVLRAVWENKYSTPYRIEILKHIFFLYLTSHWLACIWCFVAFYESQTFGPEILKGSNWIALWHNHTYGEKQIHQSGFSVYSRLNPVGWENHVQRYILALFWSVQTITSIGYGNIMPYNIIEWMMSCTLMLFSGIIWGFMISSLLTIMRRETANSFCVSRLYDVQEMVKAFNKDEATTKTKRWNSVAPQWKRYSLFPSSKKRKSTIFRDKTPEYEKNLSEVIGRRITKFVLDQMERNENVKSCYSTLNDEYLAFGSLSPQLQRMSSYLIFKSYLNAVPYLSSKYLSVDEQSYVSMNCKLRCFAAGEATVVSSSQPDDNQHDRGIFIMIHGYGFIRTTQRHGFLPMSYLRIGDAFGFEQVLIEDQNLAGRDEILFPLFARLLFVPRQIVLDILQRNPLVWKDCGRWIYLKYLLQTKFNPEKSRAEYILQNSSGTLS